jgi:hypothetical protein
MSPPALSSMTGRAPRRKKRESLTIERMRTACDAQLRRITVRVPDRLPEPVVQFRK